MISGVAGYRRCRAGQSSIGGCRWQGRQGRNGIAQGACGPDVMIPANAPAGLMCSSIISQMIARISSKIVYPANKDATALVDAIRNNPNMYVPEPARKTLFGRLR